MKTPFPFLSPNDDHRGMPPHRLSLAPYRYVADDHSGGLLGVLRRMITALFIPSPGDYYRGMPTHRRSTPLHRWLTIDHRGGFLGVLRLRLPLSPRWRFFKPTRRFLCCFGCFLMRGVRVRMKSFVGGGGRRF